MRNWITGELIGTFLLVFFGCGSVASAVTTGALIGLTVTILICLLGPLTMASFNPARDFAPRVFSSLAGWGTIPFTANGIGWLTVYIIAPILGGLLGGLAYTKLLKPAYELQISSTDV